MIRWVCPNCGSGTNAPERPRKNDVRRYCLRCSEATGLLVEREAPKLERRRQAARLRSQAKRQTRAERERRAKLTPLRNVVDEEVLVDLPAIVQQALRDMGSRSDDRVARIARCAEVTVRKRTDGFCSGHAWPTWDRIVLSVSPGFRGGYEDALILAYHEAAHLVAGYDEDDRRWHGEKFQRVLADALQSRWPFLTYGRIGTGGGHRTAELSAQLSKHLRAGGSL